MADEVGSASVAGAREKAPEIGIGMLGYAFMGKAHTNAYKKLPYMIYPPPAVPKLVAVAGRDEAAVQEAARRYGYESYYINWQDLLANPQVQLFDNCGPNNLHSEPCIAAAQAGKHILCEMPIARSRAEAKTMLDAVQQAGVKHMVSFSYRFVPAIRQAYELIKNGALGEIYYFRAVYLQEWIADPEFPMVWRLDKHLAGSGALGDLGAHIIDLARFLVGEPAAVMAQTKTFIKERPLAVGYGTGKVDVDDAFAALVEFEHGAVGTLEASRFSPGRKNYEMFEINGSQGSIRFNLEQLNELEIYWKDAIPKETQGVTHVQITESHLPSWSNLWPYGTIVSWEHALVHEITHLLDAIVNDKEIAPYGATFEDGYRNAVICDAILQSAQEGRRIQIEY